MCVCPPASKIKYSVFYVYLCSCIILCDILLLSFMQSLRQISMFFIDNKDSVFCAVWLVKTEKTFSNEVGTLPVWSNLCTLLIVVSTALWNKVTKTLRSTCWGTALQQDSLSCYERHTRTHSDTHAHTVTHSHTQWHTHTHSDTLTHTVTHSHTQWHTRTHSDTLTHTLTCTHTHTQWHTHTHSDTHAHTVTHSHTRSHARTHTHTHTRLENVF